LPHFAEEYLASRPKSRSVVRPFQSWLKATCRPLMQLEKSELEHFLLRFSGKPPTATQRHQRHLTLLYFDWLHDHALLRFDARCAWPRSNFPLPDLALQFLESLKLTHKLSTVRSHQTALRQFHIWLQSNAATLLSLDRDTICSWLNWLHARGLSPCSRVHCIQQVRSYLYWLEERDGLSVPTDTLIRGADLPKLPQYLPRPLPPDVDAQLQRRLARSENTYKLGLLLMRRTGLRVGELINLPFSCLRIDPKGNKFLKVPLGKLDTERLVPLDPQGIKTLHKLRRLGSRRRAFLLESSPGRKTTYRFYRDAIHNAAHGLDGQEPITTHRLRHTYATALLAGGMSLVGLMRLLGHKDYRMTLRYAAITDETVLIEYAAALDRTTQRYNVTAAPRPVVHLDPAQQLTDLARQLHLRIVDDHLDSNRTLLLVRRLRRLAIELRRLAKRQKSTAGLAG
jgi:site-specific recombinase XerD